VPTVTKSLGDGTQSVLLTIAIFDRLASQPGPVGISELARDIGTSKSRIFRHLQTLVAVRGDGEYEVGGRLMEFCRVISDRYDLVSIAFDAMSALRERLGHTVIISRVDANGVRVLKSIAGNSPIELSIRAGTVLPFATSAQGKVALAFMEPGRKTQKSAFAEAYEALTASQADEIATVRRQGWATAQMRQGLKGMAAPVFGPGQTLTATLGILDTTQDMGDEPYTEKARALTDAAAALSAKLVESQR
jgi:IclR family transcriptional regulator, KDG regulon repressor